MRKNLFKIFFISLFLGSLLFFNTQCGGSDSVERPTPPPQETPPPNPCKEPTIPESDNTCEKKSDLETVCTYNFEHSKQGWEPGFSDYYFDAEQRLNLESDYTPLPDSKFISTEKICSIKISGRNPHDDLFMYLKKKISGLKPKQIYFVTFNIELASNYPNDVTGLVNKCGIDHTPICLKAGAALREPNKDLKMKMDKPFYIMNLDKGNQFSGGNNMMAIGGIVVNMPAQELCDGSNSNCQYKLIQRNNLGEPFKIEADDNGEVWVIIGTDSGTNTDTKETFYYNNIELTFKKL